MSSSCSHVLPSTITASGVVEESLLSCSPSNDGMSLFSLRFLLSLFFSMTITVSASSCCHCCCCSCVLPSTITASGVVEDTLLSCSLSNDGTSLFSLHFSLSLFLSTSSCCHCCCCSGVFPLSITVSGVVVDGSLSSNNGYNEPNPKSESESSDILIDVR